MHQRSAFRRVHLDGRNPSICSRLFATYLLDCGWEAGRFPAGALRSAGLFGFLPNGFEPPWVGDNLPLLS